MTPLAALAGRVRDLAGWRRYACAFALGLATTLAQPPFHLLPLVLAYAPLVWLLDAAGGWRRVFATVWVFAFGQFVLGLYWTGVAFLVDPERFAILLPLPVLGLPAGLALLPAIAMTAAWALRPRGLARVPVYALAWFAAEYFRGHALSGFPWNLPGAIWTAFDVTMQGAALIGVYGLSLLTLLLAFSFADLRRRGAAAAVMAALFVALGIWGAWRLSQPAPAPAVEARLRLVQAAISQADKNRDEGGAAHVRQQMELSLTPTPVMPGYVIWPETAIPFPYFPGDTAQVREVLAEAAPNGLLLAGGLRRDLTPGRTPRLWNSLFVIGADGALLGAYDKQHLVPFGEYLPARTWLSRIGLDKLSPGHIDFSAGRGNGLVAPPGLPPARVLICYEAIFPNGVASWGSAEDRPGWLLNVTNDGWFGRSSGPYQHFAAARLRAVEQGLPLVRAANTGISAIIDAHGRVVVSLGLGATGIVDGLLPGSLPSTLYARLGEWIVALLFAVAVFLAALLRLKH